MATCPDCRLHSRATSRIRGGIVESCLKSRSSPCLACQKLLEIDRKIEETRRAFLGTLEELKQERDELASALNEHHDPFLTQLPVEIVSHIFALSRPYQPSLNIFNFGFDEQTNIRGVLVLGHVCLNWRNIANRTPELWTVFGTRNMTKNISVEWLKKSGELPLFVWLHPKDSEGVSQSTREFLASIAQHAHRWKVLDLQMPIDMVHILRSATVGRFWDRLEHIMLDITIDNADGPYTMDLPVSPLWLTLETTQRLANIVIDWSKLTQFSGFHQYEIQASECVHLFSNAPNLLFCAIGMATGSLETSVTLDTLVTHRSLRTLQIGAFDTNLWDYFNFPSLQALHLGRMGDSRSWISLQGFLRRSNCKIIDLGIKDDSSQQEKEILDTLKLTANIERLSINGFELAGCLLSLINLNDSILSGDPQQSNPELFPRLKAIAFYSYKSYIELDWSPLVAFIIACTSKDKHMLESVDIRFEGRSLYGCQDMIMDRTMLQQVLDIAGGLELRMVDDKGSDLLGWLCRHYGL